MFIHKVNYVDFNDNERTEELCFHLSLPEVTRLQTEIGKPLEEHIKELVSNNDLGELVAFLEKMLLSSYGKKTSDGKTFQKSKELREAFEYSQAYAEIFEAVISDKELSRKFGEEVADTGRNKKNTLEPKVVNSQPTQ